MRKLSLYLAFTLLLAAMTVACVIGAEGIVRRLDGYELFSLRLIQATQERANNSGGATTQSAEKYLASLPIAEGMRRDWFNLSPRPVQRQAVKPELSEVYRRFAAVGSAIEATHVLNADFARNNICSHPAFSRYPGFTFLFDAPNNSIFPRYRFPVNETTPLGLVTNQYGWRGPAIDFRKAAGTIRIAFVGASTTVNNHSFPFSYPELVGYWLNKWAEENGLSVKIETINAGREGMISTDIAAIVRDEILPVEPDIIVYYEGANQFSLKSITNAGGVLIPAVPPPQSASASNAVGWATSYSAIGRRLEGALSSVAREARKPAYKIDWPRGLEEENPDIGDINLPVGLPVIMRDLGDIRDISRSGGAELVISSFFWLVYDGMLLHPERNRVMYEYLNETFWPYRYRDLARLATFQNKVLKKFAEVNGLPFLDIASAMPRDPDLFVDPIHATYEGVRIHAWIAAQYLAPLLDRRIKAGGLPRPPSSAFSAHPAFPGNERTAFIHCVSPRSQRASLGNLKFENQTVVNPPASATADENLKITIPAGASAYWHAALVRLPPGRRMTELTLDLQVKVMGGRVQVGVLTEDGLHFLAIQTLEPGDQLQNVELSTRDARREKGLLVVSVGPDAAADVVRIEIVRAEMFGTEWQLLTEYAKGLVAPER